MKIKKIGFLIILSVLSLLTIGIANAAISATIQSPSSGWYNTYSILLNVTATDNANVTFNTTKNTGLTTLFTNDTQGNLTLSSTYLNEGNNTIYVYATNATNSTDTDATSVSNVAVDT
ncbi:hypothetical protein GOV06_05610, partial [Candidatus Woesearchaeota archaeon]|nr:hypothetical protein [Candidatus Woesearchaeota archaeon]